MRILVHEFASGGGLAGQPVPPSLAREGSAMLRALVADLAAAGHAVLATTDPRFPFAPPAGVSPVELPPGAALDAWFAKVDACWIVAPETGGCLERLAEAVEREGRILVGSPAPAVRAAADKAALARRLSACGIPVPETRRLAVRAEPGCAQAAALAVGLPAVVKPVRGAGSEGVTLVREAGALGAAIERAARASGEDAVLVQRYVAGTAASVSLVFGPAGATVLSVNAQDLDPEAGFAYRGGATPIEHPMASAAARAALAAGRAIPGLRGWVGVDVVLTEREAVVIEINPRLTTAYLGVRAAAAVNLAELVLEAASGGPPAAPILYRPVRFTASGEVEPAR